MQIDTYEQAVAFWSSRINYEKIGMPQDVRLLKLDRMKTLLALLGNPHEQFRSIHITGTKGKGSTATMIASVLQAAGYRTGLYTSPHLVRVEERIQINGQPIDQSSITWCMQQVATACDEVERRNELPPTFFEIITAVGMLHFAEQKVDFAVLEVGMGGRFDATNVVTPEVSVITSVSLDHMEQLGDTVEKIAFEKAGIIKEGRPVVTGVKEPGPAEVIKKQAQSLHAPLYRLGQEFQLARRGGDLLSQQAQQVQWKYGNKESPWYTLSLWGAHQAENAAVALQTIQLLNKLDANIPEAAIVLGMKQAVIPGRLETLAASPRLIVDAAHNVQSIEVLLHALSSRRVGKRSVLFAVSRDKQVGQMLNRLVGQFDEIVFTRYTSSARGADPHELLKIWYELGGKNGRVIEPPDAAWRYLVQLAGPSDLVLATGSVFLVGEIRQLYQGNQ